MNFIEATSSGRDFRRVGDTKTEFFWLGAGEERELMERDVGSVTFREPKLTWRDYFKGEFEFVEDELVEVGDDIIHENCQGSSREYPCRVMAMDEDEDIALIFTGEKACACNATLNQKTLIRKGNVHVFEGVEIIENRSHVYTVLKGSHIHPAGYYDLRNDDKTYKMTLEESDG